MNDGDGRLWQIGRCGFCGLRFEDYDPAHTQNRCWRKVILQERCDNVAIAKELRATANKLAPKPEQGDK